MNDYCITPPFITAGIKPNLLLLLDNSASMYDLAYVDKGRKQCSTAGTVCSVDSDCTGTETCVFVRDPYYCYDETYKNSNVYEGYFDRETYYYYRIPTAPTPFNEGDFAPVTTPFPSGCGSVAAGSTTKSIANTMCAEFLRPNTIYSFVAKGNYLNWLTTSKFDIEKKILTGGKYDGTGLLPESRGCVGQGYVKDANTADYVDYSGGQINNPNTGLGVTFTITGPSNPYNPTAPSVGGTTYINLLSGNTPYDAGKCQAAITAIATASGTGQVTAAVADCLSSTTPPVGVCSIKNINPNTGAQESHACVDSLPPSTPNCQPPAVPKHCAKNSSITTCTPGAASPADGCYSAANVCSAGKVGVSCSVNADCDLKKCSGDTSRTCSVTTPDCQKAEVMGTCKNGGAACRVNDDCSGKNNVCQGYVAAYNYGTCGVQTAGICSAGGDQGPCLYATGGNLGVCQFSPHETLVKTSVFFGSSMQTCWALRKNGTEPGNDEYNAIVKNCPIIYAGYKSCSNNSLQTCTADSDCGAGNTCRTGPAAIGSGNSALLCSLNYEGRMFVNNPAGSITWEVVSALPSPTPSACSATDTVKDCILKINKSFCGALEFPAVTDPTDAPSNSPITDNLPAILSGIGVDAQLGGIIGSMRAKVAQATAPTGLVQQFGSSIRLGAISFNPFGSWSETAKTGVPKICQNTKLPCAQPYDCGSGDSCIDTTSTTNLDGARVIYPVGKGLCATMTTTPCTTDAGCLGLSCLNGYCGTLGSTKCTTVANCSGSNQACISDSTGDHVTNNTLVKVLDDVRASSWTPFSEAFFNAIGYYARVPSGANAGKSRTDLRLNAINTGSTDYTSFDTAPVDFNENYNPSELRCQQNYVLLVSDGSSTADLNTTVKDVAAKYASSAGMTYAPCTGAPPPRFVYRPGSGLWRQQQSPGHDLDCQKPEHHYVENWPDGNGLDRQTQ